MKDNQTKSLDVKDDSIHQFMVNKEHDTKVALSPNGKVGVFISDDQVIIRSGDGEIIIGGGEVFINGKMTTNAPYNEKSRLYMDNPAGNLPGNVIPPFIISSFNILPNVAIILPIIDTSTMAMELLSSITALGG